MHHDITSAKMTALSDSKCIRAEQGLAVFEVAPILQPSILPSLTAHCGLEWYSTLSWREFGKILRGAETEDLLSRARYSGGIHYRE